jgi:hypothetical protein
VNGVLVNGSLSGTIPSSIFNTSTTFKIGASEASDGSIVNNFSGTIDEVRVSNVTRTADDIRQAYEVGRRTHPVTIDFAAKGDSGNLITGSGDTSFTVDATAFGAQNKGDNVLPGDKIIVRENVGGTEYIAQGDVTAVTASSGAVTVSSWDSGSTFPSGGYTANSHFFKWQREYFDIAGSLSGHRDATTRITLRVTNGHEGRTVWLDDMRSASYINRGTCDTLNASTGVCTYVIPGSSVTSTPQRYFQLRAFLTTWDTAVSPIFTDSQIEYAL